MQPFGVHGDEARPALREAAEVGRVQAVDVLRPDRSRGSPRRCRGPRGSGSWTRMPSTVGIAVERVDERHQLGLRGRRRQLVIARRRRRPRARPSSCCARRPRTPDRRRPARPRGVGAIAARAQRAPPRARPRRAAAPRSPCRRSIVGRVTIAARRRRCRPPPAPLPDPPPPLVDRRRLTDAAASADPPPDRPAACRAAARSQPPPPSRSRAASAAIRRRAAALDAPAVRLAGLAAVAAAALGLDRPLASPTSRGPCTSRRP